MAYAKKVESNISLFGIITHKSPPINTPCCSTVAALAISSLFSPDVGIMTSPPILTSEFFCTSANVSTFSIFVSYFVYNLPYKMIGVPLSVKSFFVYPFPLFTVLTFPSVFSSHSGNSFPSSSLNRFVLPKISFTILFLHSCQVSNFVVFTAIISS